ncbi:hypothetical protein TrVE_jg115 [Triparma verrucosa]|uniref:Uncharacterized protein n=1 Tax=Triparma verrucosa TaxID=1606542 RepID=A0A9W7FIN0_9STRA|nr:hypothetical protein TrVE_jg115 [Triparma verrucosa]
MSSPSSSSPYIPYTNVASASASSSSSPNFNIVVTPSVPPLVPYLRSTLPIRNRQHLKRLFKCSFVGSEAVSLIVSTGWSSTRAGAVHIGQILLKLGYIRHVTDGHEFKDSFLYYRFFMDENKEYKNSQKERLKALDVLTEEEKRIIMDDGPIREDGGHYNHGLSYCFTQTSLCPFNAGRGDQVTRDIESSQKALFPPFDSRLKYPSHTSHNSLILSLSACSNIEMITSESNEADSETKRQAITALRTKLRDEYKAGTDWKVTRKVRRYDVPNPKTSNTSSTSSPSTSSTSTDQTNYNDTSFFTTSKKLHARGPFTTEKVVGVIDVTARSFVEGFLSWENRGRWENGSFNAGVTVEEVWREDEKEKVKEAVFDEEWGVELSNIPKGMPIAKLLDRAEELERLTKQVIESDPDGPCMRCKVELPPWGASGVEERRVCKCCGIVVCTVCCCKLVYEVFSRRVVKVCGHCYRESSRVRHPKETLDSTPRAIPIEAGTQNSSSATNEKEGLNPSSFINISSMVGESSFKPDGFVGTVGSLSSLPPPPTLTSQTSQQSTTSMGSSITPPLEMYKTPMQSLDCRKTNSNQPSSDISPSTTPPRSSASNPQLDTSIEQRESELDEDNQQGQEPCFSNWDEINPLSTLAEEVERQASLKSSEGDRDSNSVNADSAGQKCKTEPTVDATLEMTKWARCKHCGQRVERTMEEIEAHSEQCHETKIAQKRTFSNEASGSSLKIDEYLGSPSGREVNGKLGGVTMDPELESKSAKIGVARVIYRTSKSPSSNLFSPRECCTLQDSFVDEEGTAYVYETSVVHKGVTGCKGHVTAEVLLLAHIARPDPNDSSRSILSVISQIDPKTASMPSWLGNILPDTSSGNSGAFESLARELEEAKKEHAELMNLDEEEGEDRTTEEGDACLDDFELLAVLGRGGFGKVMQVRHKQNGNVYAMKVLKKAELVRRRQVERTKTERHILEKATGHPFMVSLAYAFQTSAKLYMVMDFVQGGDFFTFLRKVGRMKESWVQLYICEIALALQALHDIDVVYRDLKPENVLLERDGHVKLTDFGLSRSFEIRDALPDDREKGRGAMGFTTRSFCGTEQYMAPEMLLQRGHTKGVDWWCLGLLMHEMMTGRHPFHGGTHYDTLRNMVSRQPTLDGRLSDAARSLLMGLLIKDSGKRYGCSPLGAKELQVHRFFSGLNWNKVMRKEVTAPYVPQVAGAGDTSNFEEIFTKEKAVDSVAVSTTQEKSRGWLGGFFAGVNFQNKATDKEIDKKKKKKKKKEAENGKNGKRVESLSQFDDFSFQAEGALIDRIGKSSGGNTTSNQEEE